MILLAIFNFLENRSVNISHDETVKMSEFMPGVKNRFVHSDTMTLAEWLFEMNVDLPEHSHSNEQITKVISGEFLFKVDGKDVLLSAGSSMIIPANVVHSGKAVTESHIIDVFHPVREDFKAK